MAFDHAQSPRLGQKTSVESTTVTMFDGVEIPEAAWVGQMIYRKDRQVLQVYTEEGAFEDVIGGTFGVLTYVGPDMPETGELNDLWYDSDDNYTLYIHNGTIWEVFTEEPPTRINVGEAYWSETEGLVIPLPSGQTMRVSVDSEVPSYWEGEVNATSATIAEGLLTGLLQVIGSLQLKKGVTEPVVEPTVERWYPQLLLPSIGRQRWSLTDNNSTSWAVLDRESRLIRTYDKTTGAAGSTVTVPNGATSITRVGTSYYVLWKFSGDWFVSGYSVTTGSQTQTPQLVSASSATSTPVLGTDGTNVMVSFTLGGGNVRVRRYQTNGNLVDSTDYSVGSNQQLGEVLRGDFGWGVNRVVIAGQNSGDVQVFQTGGAADGSKDFKRAYEGRICGMWWDGTRFHSADMANAVNHYGSNVDSETRNFAYSWLSGDATKRTQISPLTVFSRPRRAQIRVTVPAAPEATLTGNDNASRHTIYGATTSSVKKQADLARGTRTLILDTFLTATDPVGSNGFANVAAVGELESESGDTYIRGNDDAQIKGIDVWHNVPGVTAAPSGAAPQYRIDAGGLVHLRGRMDLTGETSGATIFTLPSGYRPPVILNGFATISGATGSWAATRVDIGSDGTVQCFWSGTEARFSLNGISFATF